MRTTCIGLYPEAIEAHLRSLAEIQNKELIEDHKSTIGFCVEIFEMVRDQGLITIQDDSYDRWRRR